MLSAEGSSTVDKDEDGENPRWRLVGVLLPPFLHGLCMCVDRPRIAEGMLPPLVSGIGFVVVRRGSVVLHACSCYRLYDGAAFGGHALHESAESVVVNGMCA